jgi:hypothetical protein
VTICQTCGVSFRRFREGELLDRKHCYRHPGANLVQNDDPLAILRLRRAFSSEPLYGIRPALNDDGRAAFSLEMAA